MNISKKYIFIFAILIATSTVLTGCGQTDDSALSGTKSGNNGEMGVINEAKDLLGISNPQKCVGQDTDVITTIYTDGDRSRYDIEGLAGSDLANDVMHSLNDGTWTYSWMDSSDTGTKIKNSAIEEIDDEDFWGEDEWYDEDMDEEWVEEDMDEPDIKCSDWRVDNKMFVPPSDVEFQDTGAMLNNVQDAFDEVNSEEYKESMRDICNILPDGSDKDDCLAEFE